jgi:gamma-glutamylcyclotransferase (GGCT)/AIG2-like uncharacterized protein YtfP
MIIFFETCVGAPAPTHFHTLFPNYLFYMTHYFAYGSNMDQEQMNKRCPDAVLIGTATLKGYKLSFTIFSPKRSCGCADITLSPKEYVHGLLYQMNDRDMKLMDKFEGHPKHYRRIYVAVETTGKDVSAFSYEVVNKIDGQRPSKHYLGLIKQAAEKFDFPKKYQLLLSAIETCD